MLANEFLVFEHSPLFFVDIIIHCSLLRTCRVRVEEKEEFLVYTVLWTLTCHPYLESATALSDKEKERKVNFRTRFFLMLANEFLAFEHSPLFFVDIIIHCSLLRTCRVRVEEKEEFLVYTVLWTLTCHPYLESATALSDYHCIYQVLDLVSPKQSDAICTAALQHADKNRSMEFLPCEYT